MHRITPAGAGKTRQPHGVRDRRGDHPRRCGENVDGRAVLLGERGSPPQVRGKLRACLAVAQGRMDHPRRCGENLAMRARCPPLRGSPPQVRGKQIYFDESVLTGRITPAGAGKSFQFVTLDTVSRDHPRRCGENRAVAFFAVEKLGSPPQVRGKLLISAGTTGKKGITPAGAGKTRQGKSQRSYR